MFNIIGALFVAIGKVITGIMLFFAALTYVVVRVLSWIGGMFWSGVKVEYNKQRISGPKSGA